MTGDEENAPRAWQRMLSGSRLDLLSPRPEDIKIDDIAHGLARVARWNGQTIGAHAFSVAQHSLLVTEIFSSLTRDATRTQRLGALLHDAPEYVIGDLISPFKAAIGLDYKAFEQRLLAAIYRRFAIFDVDDAVTSAIKRADRIAAFYEATRLAGFDVREGEKFFGRPEIPENLERELGAVEPCSTHEAQIRFLRKFEEFAGS